MKKNILSLAIIMLATLFTTSCVSKKQFQALQGQYDSLRTRHADLRGNYSTLQGQYNDAQVTIAQLRTQGSSLEERLAEERQRLADLQNQYNTLMSNYSQSVSQGAVNIGKLVDEINASNRFIHQLVDAKNRSDSLNQVLTDRLTRSLTREELQEVDVQVLKGVVYISLADNMLYKSGSYEIGERAGETLSKIAKIIMDYSDYDVLVEGNTDNVPISPTFAITGISHVCEHRV